MIVLKKELRVCEALLKLIINYLFENWVGKRKQLIIVFSKRNRPKQGAEGASVSSDARRLCDGGGPEYEKRFRFRETFLCR